MLPTIDLLVYFLPFLKCWRGLFTIMSCLSTKSPLQFGLLPSRSPVKQLLIFFLLLIKHSRILIQLTVSIWTFVKSSIQFLMLSYCRSYWILGLLVSYGPGFKRICPHVGSDRSFP